MKLRRNVCLLGLLVTLAIPALGASACPSLLNHRFPRLQDEQPQSLCQYAGQVVLVVNTASNCGYTGQYEGLEALYRKYRAEGFVVLGFPANDFGGQEPGDNRQIAQFCRTAYGVEFPMFAKTAVKGPGANAFYRMLAERSGQVPRWNFHKYLIDRSGNRVEAFASAVEPRASELVSAVEKLIAQP